jgi:hypothetical protein
MPNVHIARGQHEILRTFIGELNALVTDIRNRITTWSGHTHGGVTTGAGSTAAGPSIPAPTSQEVAFHTTAPSLVILRELAAQMTALRNDLSAFDGAMNAHTHGGVTAGTGSTGTGPTLAAAVVPLPSIFEIKRGHREILRLLVETFNQARANFLALRAAMNAHTHGGVSTGAATTASGGSAPALVSDMQTVLVG